MTYCFYLATGLFLVIIQTTIKPYFPVLLSDLYDLLIPFVIYLAIFRPSGESIPVVLFFGLIMDNFTGGPFGFYVSAYLWLFVGVKAIMKIFQLKNTFILLFIVAFGVLAENLMFIGVHLAFKSDVPFPIESPRPLITQVLWAVATGAVLLMLIKFIHNGVAQWQDKLLAQSDKNTL